MSIRPLFSITKISAAKELVLVSGARGGLGRAIIAEAFSQRKKVFAFTSQPHQVEDFLKRYGLPSSSQLIWIDSKAKNLKELIDDTLSEEQAQTAHIINTIGGTPKGITPGYTYVDLYEKNVVAPLAFIQKTVEALIKPSPSRSPIQQINVIHLSSIAASLPGQEERCIYAKIRQIAENKIFNYLQELKKKHSIEVRFTALRIGFVIQDLQNNGEQYVLDTGYEFGMHHMSHFPLIFALGHGKHPTQPIHIKDVTEGIKKIMENPDFGKKGEIVNAVTKGNEMPFLDFIASLHPKFMSRSPDLYALLIPYELAEAITPIVSAGHLQDYAIQFCKAQDLLEKEGLPNRLDSTKFENLLGKKPISILDELYYQKKQTQFICAKPEIRKLVSAAFLHLCRDPGKGKNLWRALQAYRSQIQLVQVIPTDSPLK